MALTPLGTVTALATVLEYFRPSKSPYLLVIVAGIGGILFSCSSYFDQKRFYWIAVPIYLVLFFLTRYSLISVESTEDDYTKSEVEEQLKFSRSVCIITGIGCLVSAGYQEDVNGGITHGRFALIYIASMFQVFTFVVYTAARIRKEEPVTSANHFQIALVTSAYLIGMTSCIHLMKFWGFEVSSAENGDSVTDKIDEYALSAALFLMFWIWCQFYWIRRLRSIIRISVEE